MAKLEPLADANSFLDLLASTGLVAAERISELREKFAGQEAKAVARELLKSQELTKWQAQQLLHGFGRLVVGKYKLLDLLGRGPMGRVYLAEHSQLNKRVSLKELSRRYSSQPAVLKRFLEEANRAAALNQRNLTHIFDVGNEGDRYYLVMEYVEGQDLQRLIESKGKLPAVEAVELIRQAAEGLAHAHKQNIFHGDLKPSNLCVDASGVVKILDLGMSELTDLPLEEGGEQSTESPSLFALSFKAPEQVGKRRPADAAGDIFSLGALLFYSITGTPPQVQKEPSADELTRQPGVSAELAQLCVAMISARPEARPQSAPDVAATLERILLGKSAEKPAERAAPARPSSAGKQKRPLVAKPLEDPAAGLPVVGESVGGTGDDTLADFSIQTRRKKKPAPAATSQPASVSEAGPAKAPPAPSSKRNPWPWIIGAGIGGGVLAIAGVAAIVWVVMNTGQTTAVPQDKAIAKADTKAAPSAEASPTEAEANPEADPTVEPAAADVAAATKGAAPTKGTEESAKTEQAKNEPAKTEPATTEPAKTEPAETEPAKTEPAKSEPAKTEPTKTEPAKSEPTKTEPVKTEPAKTEPAKTEPAKTEPAKTEPAKTEPAKTEPAKTEPAKAEPMPAANPFQGFATAVSLPPLEEMGKPVADATTPVTIGSIKLPPSAICLVRLRGGENASKLKQKFTLDAANQGTAERDWEFKLHVDPSTQVVIAKMSLKEDQLSFQWTEEATKQAAAPFLCNCTLSMTAGSGTHEVALRKPVVVEPITVELDRSGLNGKWTIEYPPNAKEISVQLGPLEAGPPKFKVEPKTDLAALKDSTYFWVGNADDALILGFKVDLSMPAKLLQVEGTPHYKLEGMNRPERFIKTTTNKLSDYWGKRLQAATFGVETLKKAKTQNKQAETQKAQQLSLATQEVELSQKVQAQVEVLKELAQSLGGKAKLHVRAYYIDPADGAKVELLNTGGPTPTAAPPPMAPKN